MRNYTDRSNIAEFAIRAETIESITLPALYFPLRVFTPSFDKGGDAKHTQFEPDETWGLRFQNSGRALRIRPRVFSHLLRWGV